LPVWSIFGESGVKRRAPNANDGFTLVELALVMAIIAILAAVAIPRFGNVTASGECTTIKNMVTQLISAASIWAAENRVPPDGFTDFVIADTLPPAGTPRAPTISLRNFGVQAATSPCIVSLDTITCNGTFKSYAPSYKFASGTVTLTRPVTAMGGAPLCQ
jgi:type IV pilus assembly protein PilA